MEIRIDELMHSSGVGFGTSGARGLVEKMTDQVCYAYTRAFIQVLKQQGELASDASIAIAGDYRPSSPRIMGAVAMAIQDEGLHVINCGGIPSPAVAYFGQIRAIPSIMVTGSHIPDDRNGIKFNKADGEILKQDEQQIRAQTVSIPSAYFDADGSSTREMTLPNVDASAYTAYVERYTHFFTGQPLHGRHVALYEHSSVARESLNDILTALGAQVTKLGYSDIFMPVDTEAIRAEDVALARQWAGEQTYDCIVSADGDGDRPLVSDEHGEWLRGDIAGILTARYLGIDTLATPVSSNTAVEKSGYFRHVARTRIGSPYVIEAMNQALASSTRVAGYEANGGFLLANDLESNGHRLARLPTRDAVIVILAVMLLAARENKPISALLTALPQRYTASDRIKNFPTELSQAKLQAFAADRALLAETFRSLAGELRDVDTTDGLRMTFANDAIIHLRPSGNAPELRCYTEAESTGQAHALNQQCLAMLAEWR